MARLFYVRSTEWIPKLERRVTVRSARSSSRVQGAGALGAASGTRGGLLMATDEARRVLLDAIAARVFPSAVVHVGSSGGLLWRDRLGTRTFEAESVPVTQTTAYDLASLTKPIATTTVVMDLVRRGALRLDERLAACFSEWRGVDRESVAVRDLLEHSSGLPARLVDPPPAGRREFEHDICTMPLEYAASDALGLFRSRVHPVGAAGGTTRGMLAGRGVRPDSTSSCVG